MESCVPLVKLAETLMVADLEIGSPELGKEAERLGHPRTDGAGASWIGLGGDRWWRRRRRAGGRRVVERCSAAAAAADRLGLQTQGDGSSEDGSEEEKKKDGTETSSGNPGKQTSSSRDGTRRDRYLDGRLLVFQSKLLGPGRSGWRGLLDENGVTESLLEGLECLGSCRRRNDGQDGPVFVCWFRDSWKAA